MLPERARRAAEGEVVLGAAVDVVERLAVVDRHLVELHGRQIRLPGPALAAVEGLVDAAVAADDEVIRAFGVDPERVVVDVLVPFADLRERGAGVLGDHQEDVHRVDAPRLLRIGDDLVVVLRAARDVGALLLPALAAVGRAEEAALALGRLDHGVDPVGSRRSHRQADAAELDLGQTRGDLAPAPAAVGGLVDRRLRAAVDQGPDVAPALVGGGVDGVGIVRVEGDVRHAGVVRDREHLRPVGAAVGRLVEAAIAARAPERPLGGDPDDVGVARVDQDPADVLRALQSDILPALAAVDRLVDAVAVGHRALRVVLAAADPDGERVVRIDRHRADRERPLAVEDRRPGGAGVLGRPDAARGDRDDPAKRLGRVDRDLGDAPRGERRADLAQREAGEQLLGGMLFGRGRAFGRRGAGGQREGEGEGGHGTGRRAGKADHRSVSRVCG